MRFLHQNVTIKHHFLYFLNKERKYTQVSLPLFGGLCITFRSKPHFGGRRHCLTFVLLGCKQIQTTFNPANMKITHRYLYVCIALLSATFAVNAQAFRIDDPVGTVVEYSYLDKKEKITSASRMELVSKEKDVEGEAFNIRTTFPAEKEPIDMMYKLIFTGDGIKPDKNFIFSNAMMEQLKGQANITFTGDIPIMPDNLSVGQALPLYEIAMTIDFSGGAGGVSIKSTTTSKTISRKVLRKESVTVPAGTYEAFVINEEVTATSAIMGIKTSIQSTTDSWVVPGLGFVKQMHYDKKGKITSGLVLSKRTN